MKALLSAAVSVHTVHDCVMVKVGEFSVPLESVKKLKDLQDSPVAKRPQQRSARASRVCDSPDLPKELQHLCADPHADVNFEELNRIALSPALCEICAYAACTGC
ncbi:guanylin-like [Carettochelys insculpta]|uniref:guanylin-like n=1 Tax=Carettochelys insculpta TaxID=44489 RepID=UPI003EB7D431